MSYVKENILRLRAPQKIGGLTSVDVPVSVLNSLPCGLFRCDLNEAYQVMPELADLYDSCPIDASEYDQWELDLKIHMLMPRQWPCIPNWHCDNVPRDANGITDYARGRAVAEQAKPMYLWVSGTPCTQFLSRDVTMPYVPGSHSDVAKFIAQLAQREDLHDDRPLVTNIDPQQWYSMDCNTPHRGMQSDKNQWRIFARLTHKSILPTRQQTSVIRRHCQVYLDASEFSW